MYDKTFFPNFAAARLASRGALPAILAALLLSPHAATAQSSAYWKTLKTFRAAGATEGSFEGDKQTTGSYTHVVAVTKVNDESDTSYDWYRIDLSIESAISKYRKGETVCGWWTDKVTAGFTLKTKDGIILDYAPETSQGSVSKTYNIAVEIGMSGPNGAGNPSGQLVQDLGYKVTQEAPDLGIKVQRNTTAETIAWTAGLKGCKNTGEGALSYTGASKIAKSTFVLKPSIVVRVPQGKQLVFQTSAFGIADGFVHAKQKQIVKNGLKVPKTRSSKYTFDTTITCSATSCSSSPGFDSTPSPNFD
ncbi:MAG: hypothetical protein GC201_13695 [Alphaproteobacteria bacterium]|nr:hypothetical protein [Alphaproteobacteria bacterium]